MAVDWTDFNGIKSAQFLNVTQNVSQAVWEDLVDNLQMIWFKIRWF